MNISSPNGKLTLTLSQQSHVLNYTIDYDGRAVILSSEMAIELDNHHSQLALGLVAVPEANWFSHAIITDVQHTSSDSQWQPVYGERSCIRDHFNQMVICMHRQDHPEQIIHLEIRAYDAGIAFRAAFPEDPTAVYYHIVAENTTFQFPEGTYAWFEQWAQGPYHKLPLEDWPDTSERPLTLSLANGLSVSLAEACMVDYARTNFKLSDTQPNTLVTDLYGAVDVITPFATPWRVVMVAEQPGQLLENNDILLNLNPPCVIEDTRWIKPGKCIRDMTITTSGSKACIDFAVTHNLQYVLIDWGWYGVEREVASDASEVHPDPRLNPSGDLDLHEIIRYGKEKGIGIFVYVNQRALVQQLDEILPLYQQWGLAGVKFGFVQVGSHRWTVWMHEAVKKAAQYKLLVDIHDEYRPSGFSRTYPNLLTQEGIRGNEEMPDATHNCILPFTRFVAGAADYTISYYKQLGLGDFHGKQIQTTSVHQMALAVIYYSPLQVLFWYDQPSDYQGEPEIGFFEQVSTVWDETRVLDGQIGEFVVVARRCGCDWFVGAITNTRERQLAVTLNYLEEGVTYQATSYVDDATAKTRTRVAIRQSSVQSNTTMEMHLCPSGGYAIWLQPV